MVGPARKREVVGRLVESHGVSERRACRVIAQPRSSQRYQAKDPQRDAALARELREFSRRRPRLGYRMATADLRRKGWEINPKRVRRVWLEEGLKVARKGRRKRLCGSTEAGSQMLRAGRPNQVWSYDFVFDETTDGRRLKWLPVCDEFTRENVALEVERTMAAGDVVRILDQAVRERGVAPEFIRSDNGPEFIAKAVVDWISLRGFKTLFIEPGSPWQNAYSESFNSRFRDEFLNCESFSSLLEAKVLGKEFRTDYNHLRTHSSLGYQPPAEYAASCQEAAYAPLQPPLGSIYPNKITPKNTNNQPELS
jgi:transposase InsO family protein